MVVGLRAQEVGDDARLRSRGHDHAA
jgi:hypothetical protein